jgi:hypothetical protein
MATFGISHEQYDAMLVKQGGVCAICRNPEPALDSRTGKPRGLAVDHTHKDGGVRGLLCSLCNRGLGMFRDDATLLSRAIQYVAASRSAA